MSMREQKITSRCLNAPKRRRRRCSVPFSALVCIVFVFHVTAPSVIVWQLISSVINSSVHKAVERISGSNCAVVQTHLSTMFQEFRRVIDSVDAIASVTPPSDWTTIPDTFSPSVLCQVIDAHSPDIVILAIANRRGIYMSCSIQTNCTTETSCERIQPNLVTYCDPVKTNSTLIIQEEGSSKIIQT